MAVTGPEGGGPAHPPPCGPASPFGGVGSQRGRRGCAGALRLRSTVELDEQPSRRRRRMVTAVLPPMGTPGCPVHPASHGLGKTGQPYRGWATPAACAGRGRLRAPCRVRAVRTMTPGRAGHAPQRAHPGHSRRFRCPRGPLNRRTPIGAAPAAWFLMLTSRTRGASRVRGRARIFPCQLLTSPACASAASTAAFALSEHSTSGRRTSGLSQSWTRASAYLTGAGLASANIA